MPVFRGRLTKGAEINLMPLIDVIFILLIFFMIAARFGKPVLPVDLPEASAVETEETRNSELVVREDKKMELDGMPLEIDELGPCLKMKKQEDPEMSVTLSCDKSLPFGFIVRILDELNGAGIDHVDISHEPVDR